MRLKEKTERRLRNVLISFTIICLTPLCEQGRILKGAHAIDAFAGKDITCVIALGDEMYGGQGLETGLNYELLNKFARDNKCNINIIAAEKGINYIDSLKNGNVDIVIAHSENLSGQEGIEVSKKVNEHSAWAVMDENENELRQINIWISPPCTLLKRNMARKSRNHYGFSFLFLCPNFLFRVMRIYNPFNCSINRRRIMRHPEAICENKIGHSIDLLYTKTFFKLSFILFFSNI